MLGDWNFACTSSTFVDWALAGSQADELFFSAPVSLPANGPSTATMISQKTRTAHLVRRPLAMPTIALARLMVIPQDGWPADCRWQHYRIRPGAKSRHISSAGILHAAPGRAKS